MNRDLMQEEQQLDMDARVAVYPFTRQAKGDEVVVGRPDTRTYLALPPEAVEVLDDLAEGKTLREARDLHRARHGEVPDMESFVDALDEKNLVRVLDQGEALPDSSSPWWEVPAHAGQGGPAKRHFIGIRQAWAQRLCGRGALLAAFSTMALALVAVALQPSIVPGRDALYFPEHQTLSVLIVSLWGFVSLFLHEMAHLVSARALGVDSSMGISHRMYYLVMETDLTGLWSVDKRQRYLPILAGPLLDLASAAVLLLVSFAQIEGWIGLPDRVHRILQAIVVTYFLRVLWQCFLFLRTDFYFVIVTAFDCGNLMENTRTYLKQLCARWVPFYSTHRELSAPAAEVRVVRAYAPLWIFGRLVALASLIFVALPVMGRYTASLASTLARGYSADPRPFVDASLLLVLVSLPFFTGLFLWIKSLLRPRRT